MTKKSKHEVSYSKGMAARHCGICAHYRSKGKYQGTCTKVEGVIDPKMWCRLYSPREDKE